MIPVITAPLDLGTDCYELYATSYGQTTPAGPRLFRSKPHPDIEFQHADEASAERDRAKLQAYVDRAFSGKSVKTKGREEAEVTAPSQEIDTSNAIWNL